MLQFAVLVTAAWFAAGLGVALAAGRAARRSGLETVSRPTRKADVVSVAANRVDELSVRRTRRASIGV